MQIIATYQGGKKLPRQTAAGMDRRQAFATDRTWSGFVTTESRRTSGWHHPGGSSFARTNR
jgi:hypothetical protein